MNIWLGIIVMSIILILGLVIFIKHKNVGSIIWDFILFAISSISLWFGGTSDEVWMILLCSIAVAGCLIIEIIHAYEKIIANGKKYHSAGEDKRAKPFGNGYWR